ncbi:protease [Clostridia bacterium]|nr:protease [Clostridia bacterium]
MNFFERYKKIINSGNDPDIYSFEDEEFKSMEVEHFSYKSENEVIPLTEYQNPNGLYEHENPITDVYKAKNLKGFYEHYKGSTFIEEKKTNRLWIAVAFVLVIAITIGCVAFDFRNKNVTNPNYTLSLISTERDIALKNENGEYTTVGIAEVIMTSIVAISKYEYGLSETLPSGSSSGIILTEDGYILTNAHCINGGDKIEVILKDDRKFVADIVGYDAKSDVAVIKISAKGLIPAKFADSDNVKLGEKCVAIGNPANFKWSITEGIISGTKRYISTGTNGFEMECFQTSAALSPGNSGGALCNMYGEVIGITSSKDGGYLIEGLGFAITVKAAKPIIEEIIQKGYIENRYRLGITAIETTNPKAADNFEEATGFDLPSDTNGLIVWEIAEDCRVAESDLKQYDIIIEANGEETSKFTTLSKLVSTIDDKNPIKLTVLRVGKDGYTKVHIDVYLTKDTSGNF